MKFQIDDGKYVRLSLTENCNYRCFFCHEEGVSMKEQRTEAKKLEDIYQLIENLMDRGYTDITLTGGEPLLKKDWCITIIDRLSALSNPPDLTIVTNGVVMDQKIIESAKNYAGDFKFNISMHHTNKEKYLEIVNPKSKNRDFQKIVIDNIKNAVKHGVSTKLNFVILKDVNNSFEDLISMLELGKDLKVTSIKFLEFLVTDKLIDKYNFYFELDAVKERLKDYLTLVHTSLRTEYFAFKDSDLMVELSKCPCSIGCKNCEFVNGLTITSELKYFPCFFRSSQEFYLPNNIDAGINAGEKIIQEFSNKYEYATPFKIHQPKGHDEKSSYLYKSSLKLHEIRNLIEDLKGKLMAKRVFSEYVYKGKNYNNIVKTYKDTINDKIFLVNKDVFLGGEYGNYLVESFNSGFQEQVTHMDRFIEENGQPIGNNVWSIEFYKLDNMELSIGSMDNNDNIYIVTNKQLNKNLLPDVAPLNNTIEHDIYNY